MEYVDEDCDALMESSDISSGGDGADNSSTGSTLQGRKSEGLYQL